MANLTIRENIALLSPGLDWAPYFVSMVILYSVYKVGECYTHVLRHIPGPTPWPFLGNALQIDTSAPHASLTNWAKEYGDIFRFKLFGKWTVVLNSVDLLRETLLKNGTTFAGRPQTFTISYLTYDAEDIACQNYTPKLRRMRKIGIAALKAYTSGMERLNNFVTEELRDLLDEFGHSKGNPFDCRPILHSSVCSIMTSIILGKRCRSTDEEVLQLITVVKFLNEDIHPTQGALLDMFPWLRFFGNNCFKKMQEAVKARDLFVDKQFQILKDSYDPSTVRGIFDALFESQLDANVNKTAALTDTDIKAIIFDLIGTGTSALSVTLYTIILVLLKYPDVQEKITAEIERVVVGERLPTLEDRCNMPYTQAMIYELIRYQSLSPMLVPRTTTENTYVRDFFIPAETQVVVNAWSIHHDERYYEDPWSFKPERFLDNEGNLVNPDHPARRNFCGFGVGARNCIGENLAKTRIFLFVSSLVRRFKFLPPDGEDVVSADPRTFSLGYSLVPNSYRVRAIKRRVDLDFKNY